MARPVALLIVVVAALLTLSPVERSRAADGDSPGVARRRPLVVGTLGVRPADVIAVYRPVDQQAVAVYIGRTGHAVQVLFFRDAREAAAVFDGLWNNKEVTKDAGDDDAARPLTRMIPKDAGADERNTACLMLNVDRVLACQYDTSERTLRVYFDKLTSEPLGATERDHIEIRSSRDEAEKVMLAYKACLYTK